MNTKREYIDVIAIWDVMIIFFILLLSRVISDTLPYFCLCHF